MSYNNNGPLRRIVKRDYLRYYNTSRGSYRLTLICGHVEYRIRSEMPLNKARC